MPVTSNSQSIARHFVLAGMCVFGSILVSVPMANAASVSYGDVQDFPLAFSNIMESSGTDGVPLFGAPTAAGVGLNFNPTSFVASATGGDADITDGQLNFRIESASNSSNGFRELSVGEFGDYTLASNNGIAGTGVTAAITMFITVREVNSVAVTPFMSSYSNSFSRSLGLDDGDGLFLKEWTLGLDVDLGQKLVENGYLNDGDVVTLADVVLDNQLIALTGSGTLAFIAKKGFALEVMDGNPVPLPAGIWGLLAGVGLLAGRTVARRRQPTLVLS